MTEIPKPPSAAPAKPKMRRRTRVLLVVSLMLNLLVIGVMGGAIFGQFKGDPGPRSHLSASSSPPYIRAMSHEDRRKLGRAIRDVYRDRNIDRRADRVGHQQVLEALSATPMNRATIDQMLSAQQAVVAQRFLLAQNVWLDRVSAMNETERAAYLERLREVLAKSNRRPPPHRN